MAQGSGMYAGDVIEDALTIPMDWAKLEALAHEVLLSDDFPTLRKIGGSGDQGMDAVEEAFFDGNRKVMTVVQVTSAQAARVKVLVASVTQPMAEFLRSALPLRRASRAPG